MPSLMRLPAILLTGVLLLTVAACDSTDPDLPRAPTSIPGTWRGTVTSQSVAYTVDLDLTESGGQVVGTSALTSAQGPCSFSYVTRDG